MLAWLDFLFLIQQFNSRFVFYPAFPNIYLASCQIDTLPF